MGRSLTKEQLLLLWEDRIARQRDSGFVYDSLTELERDIPTRYTEPNNELTRAWVMGRDKREFGQNSHESGWLCPQVDVSRDTVRESTTLRG